MKKIIIFNSGSSIYGAERGLINLVNALKDRFEITVVLPQRGILENRLKEISSGIDIKVFPLPILTFSFSPFYYIRFILLSILDIIYFTFYVIFKDIDIICTNSLLLSFPCIIAKLTRRRHIWCVREFFPPSLLNSILGIFVNRFSDGVICQSETIRKRLFLSDKASIVYEPINVHDYKVYDSRSIREELNLPRDSTVITVISRLHPLKGQYEFIKEIKPFLKESKDLFLIIVGDISPHTLRNRLYKKRIERLVDREGLKNVTILGFRDDIDKILSLSDICVFPFKREEPFGIAVQEALAFGKITFFPNSGGLREIHDIFKTGQEYDITKIIETATKLRNRKDETSQRLNIPDIVSFSTYKNRIVSYF